MAVLDYNGLLYYHSGLKSLFVAQQSGKGLSTNDFTTAEKEKLAGIAEQANNYVHPTYTAQESGLYKITVDATGHVSAVTAVAKADITDLGIPGQDTTYDAATTESAGLMSAADKDKLDGIAVGANNYSHPTYTAQASGLYKVTIDSTGHVSAVEAVAKADITALGIPAQDTTYEAATQSVDGLMSSSDKTKLDGFGAASTYALKSEIVNAVIFKGSVATVADLPASGNRNGDMYDVLANDHNYIWDGTAWDDCGETFSFETITNTQIDTILAS